uniref:HotDog ACOT-type domain-containing protein n=1 Tax=Ascaris lumbricoides TaxID=6252 RepID=A0A0M3I4L2_ASCLU
MDRLATWLVALGHAKMSRILFPTAIYNPILRFERITASTCIVDAMQNRLIAREGEHTLVVGCIIRFERITASTCIVDAMQNRLIAREGEHTLVVSLCVVAATKASHE